MGAKTLGLFPRTLALQRNCEFAYELTCHEKKWPTCTEWHFAEKQFQNFLVGRHTQMHPACKERCCAQHSQVTSHDSHGSPASSQHHNSLPVSPPFNLNCDVADVLQLEMATERGNDFLLCVLFIIHGLGHEEEQHAVAPRHLHTALQHKLFCSCPKKFILAFNHKITRIPLSVWYRYQLNRSQRIPFSKPLVSSPTEAHPCNFTCVEVC